MYYFPTTSVIIFGRFQVPTAASLDGCLMGNIEKKFRTETAHLILTKTCIYLRGSQPVGTDPGGGVVGHMGGASCMYKGYIYFE
jgi:hypothetical protein